MDTLFKKSEKAVETTNVKTIGLASELFAGLRMRLAERNGNKRRVLTVLKPGYDALNITVPEALTDAVNNGTIGIPELLTLNVIQTKIGEEDALFFATPGNDVGFAEYTASTATINPALYSAKAIEIRAKYASAE
jgi:hypothetical protein